MSGSVNKVIIIGNVCRDVDIRTFQSGGRCANMSVATNQQWKDKDGNKQEKTEFHNVVIFNEHLVKVVESYVKKGSKIYIEGQLETRKWQDQSGQDCYKTEIVLRPFNGSLTLLDSKPQSQPQNQPDPNAPVDDMEDSDIPF